MIPQILIEEVDNFWLSNEYNSSHSGIKQECIKMVKSLIDVRIKIECDDDSSLLLSIK